MRALLGYSAASWLSAIIGFLALPLATRSFSQEIIGQLNLILACAIVLQTIALMGLDQGYMRHYFELKNQRQRAALLAFCTLIPVLVTAFLALLVLVFNVDVSAFFGTEGANVCLALALAILALVMVRMAACYCRASARLPLFIFFTVCFTILSKCPYLLNFGEKNLPQTLSVMCTAFLCAALASAAMMLPGIRGHSWADMRTIDQGGIIRYSFPMMPAMLLANLNTYVPLFAIRLMAGYDDLGIYSMAATVASVVGVVSAGVNSFWPTYVYEHYFDRHETVKTFHKALTTALFLMGTILIGLRCLVPWFLGPGYEQSSILFAVLVISPICYSIGETSGIGIQIAKRSRIYLAIYATGLVLNVVLAAMLTAAFGMLGAAASVATVGIIMLGLKTTIGNKYYDSIGSARWWLACAALLIAQCLSAVSMAYPLSIAVSIASVALYPLLVGIREFKATVCVMAQYVKKGAGKE